MENLNDSMTSPELSLFSSIPERLSTVSVKELGTVLPGPSLIEIPGKISPPLFISVLLHGNETTGFLAMQEIIEKFNLLSKPSPREILLFVGNINAAMLGVRRQTDEPDYNRIWNGGNRPEHFLAKEVINQVSRRKPFAAIDIHNNTGKNPHYACINRTNGAFINLARRFSKTIVYFTEPHEVISIALSRLCPSVTLECGFSGDSGGLSHVGKYIEHCLTLPPEKLFSPPANRHNDVYHTIARITVPDRSHLGFGTCPGPVDICFRDDLEELNFTTVPKGTKLGKSAGNSNNLKVTDNNDRDVTTEYFSFDGNAITTRKTMTPSMFTKNETIIHQDCFGYIMEPYPLNDE